MEKLNEELTQACRNDWLLGIYNRGTFEGLVRGEFERMRRESKPISILMVDLDHFKQYNDIYGHQAGDEVLQKVTAIIKQLVRGYDVFGRYGGEELALCLPGAGREEAIEVASRIVERVYAAGMYHSGNPPYGKVTVSVGVASVDDAKDSHFEKLIDEADDNMYVAKRATRNTHYPKE